MKKIFVILVLAIATSAIALGQMVQVTGTVTSQEDGLSLPGVSVTVRGSTVGTLTDSDGRYNLSVPQGMNTLVFSFIGMKTQEVPIQGRTRIDIVMVSDLVGLDEVVVTAVGISRDKRELGYNVQSVQSEVLTSRPNSDIVNSLAGRASGIQVISTAGDAGAAAYLTIRGSHSITGNNEPLFVVNGMPIISGGQDTGVDGVSTSSRSIDLNPDDIESITVLKGGAATALYGLRAANGALIITTKSGKNLTNRKIEFHTSVGADMISQTAEMQNLYAQGLNGVWESGNAASFGPKIADLEYDGDTNYKWDPNGRLVPKGTGNGKPAVAYDPYEFFQTGLNFNNRLSMSNGNDLGSYFFSVSNLMQNGIVPNNEFGRTTLRLNATSKLSKKVTVGGDFAYTNSQAVQIQKGSNVSGIMLGLVRTARTFDNSAGYIFPDGTQRNYRNGGGYDNPYWVSNMISFNEDINRFTGSANLNVAFTESLSLSYTGGIDWFNRRYNNKFAVYSRAFPAGYYDEYMNYNGIFNSDLLLNFQKDLGDDFDFKITIGNNMQSTFSKYLYGDADGLQIRDFYQLSNSPNNTVSHGTTNYRTAAFFGDVSFAYKSLVYLGMTGRNEWSTTMPKANLSAFYPSVSLSFVFTELGGLKDNNILSYGKIRGSVARTANIAGPYNTSNYFFSAGSGDGWTNGVGFPYLGNSGFSISDGLGNPDLKHETMDSWEAGVELRFFKNRIIFDGSYFYNLNKDLLMSVPIAASSGFTSVYMNAASMETDGIELSLDITPVSTKNFNWNFMANFTKLKNMVKELAPGVQNLFLGGFVEPQVRAVAGQEYGTIFGLDWYRAEDGTILINDDPTDSYRDGYPFTNSGVMVPIGKVNPDWTANVTNTLSYRGVALSFMWDIKKGGNMYNGTVYAMNYFGTSAATAFREVYYTPEGSIDFTRTPADNIKVFEGVYGHLDVEGNPTSSGVENITPVVLDEAWFRGHGSNFGGGPTAAAIEPAGWVRLRDISLSYDIPVKKKVFQYLQVYVTGKNLLLFTPYSGIDPETNLQGSSNGQGMDYFNNPGTKSYLAGLKVTF
ncbi:MAG: SusC/RagA family TonB-linked outer membrane protein [Bacteroidales bacterium]